MMEMLEKMNLLREYVHSNPKALDLSFINDDLSAFPFRWNSKVMSHLYLFAKTGTGSYIGFWSPNEPINNQLSALPIVWIDHEGVPISVFGQSFDEFLSLLHYDTGLIYEILVDNYFFKEDPIGYENPQIKFTESYVKKYLKALEKKKSPCFKKFKSWITNTCNKPQPNNPILIINDAIIHNPDFNQWLKTINK